MRDLPRSGIDPVSPELAGRFFTIEPPGKLFKKKLCFKKKKNVKENVKGSILELVPE